MKNEVSNQAGERTQKGIERTPEDTARFHEDMKRLGERTQHAPPLNWICECGNESRGVRNTHCPKCSKERRPFSLLEACKLAYDVALNGLKGQDRLVFASKLATAIQSAARERDTLRVQRDELLAACKELLATGCSEVPSMVYGVIRAAVERAEKEVPS